MISHTNLPSEWDDYKILAKDTVALWRFPVSLNAYVQIRFPFVLDLTNEHPDRKLNHS